MRRTTLTAVSLIALAVPLGGTSPARAAEPMCDGKVATVVVATATNGWTGTHVSGTPGDDVIVGTEGRDTIDGGSGHDTICGLGGDDRISGGGGNDRLFGGLDGVYEADEDFWGDRIAPGPGDDHVDLGHDPQAEDLWIADRGYWDQISFRDAAGPVTVDLAAGTATGEGTDTIAPIVYAAGIEGSQHADHLTGTDLDDWITAGGGNDTVHGRAGDDLIDADQLTENRSTGYQPSPGDDVVSGGPGHDQIIGGYGTDMLRGDEGHDAISISSGVAARAYGGPGRDSLGGYGVEPVGQSTFSGGAGNDNLSPWIADRSDRAVVRGGRGRDTYQVNLSLRVAPHRSHVVLGGGRVRAKAGTPVRYSSAEVYTLSMLSSSARVTWYGTGRAETFNAEGHEARVRAVGRGGNDRLTGGWRKDVLDGGPGRDQLDGSNGRDRCLRGERLTSCELR